MVVFHLQPQLLPLHLVHKCALDIIWSEISGEMGEIKLMGNYEYVDRGEN